jgi:hypothetical protein
LAWYFLKFSFSTPKDDFRLIAARTLSGETPYK